MSGIKMKKEGETSIFLSYNLMQIDLVSLFAPSPKCRRLHGKNVCSCLTGWKFAHLSPKSVTDF